MLHREEVIAGLKRAGFHVVTLDLEGYRQGSHNLSLGRRSLPIALVRQGER
jgi:PP-loop superfamily ATP-utilizing enzyme